MKVVNVSEASNVQLDWLVRDIEFTKLISQGSHVKDWVYADHKKGLRTDPYTTDWLFMGEIVDREIILFRGVYGEIPSINAYFYRWGTEGTNATGADHRIAAARCYIKSVRGETAEVPDDL